MKYLWLSDDYLPRRGGSLVMYHNICSRLGAGAVRVVTRLVRGDEDFDAGTGYPVTRMRPPLESIFDSSGMMDAGMTLPLLRGGWRSIRECRPDVIHCGEALPSGLAGYLLGWIFSIPFIIWLHDNPFGAVSRLRYPLRKFLCRRAGGIAASSTFARDEAAQGGISPERIAFIQPGVDTSALKPSTEGEKIRNRFGISGGKVLLTLARLVRHKGQDTVIKSLPRLIEKHPDLVYLVAGTGPEAGYLEGVARDAGVEDRVIFSGFVLPEEVPAYYNACDLFIMLNREEYGVSWEGCGIVFLEAGACGKAVVGGRSGGVSDSVIHGRTGVLVPPCDEDEIVRAVDALLCDDALRERMGRAARERVVEEFKWEKTASETAAFSERVVRDYSGPGKK